VPRVGRLRVGGLKFAEDFTDAAVQHPGSVSVWRIANVGRYQRRASSGATCQSSTEVALLPLEAPVGVKPVARTPESQRVEALAKSRVLDRRTPLGMSGSERLAMD